MMTDFTKYPRSVVIVSLTALALVLETPLANAADIVVSALFSGKAVLVIDGAKPQTVSVGQTTSHGVKLLSASSESAIVEYRGERQTLTLGQGTRVAGSKSGGSVERVTLTGDSRGHFVTTGSINGVTVQFMIDTGASTVALSTAEARRLGIDYHAGE